MRIEVVVSEWEQACCGAAFHVGGEVTWKLLATDPATRAPGGITRFLEEHHGETPEDVQHWEVAGTVRSIAGIAYPETPVTGERRSFTLDTEHPIATAITAVGEPDMEAPASVFDEYWVELDVAEDCLLPSFSLSDSVREQRTSALREEERDRARMRDAVGVVLERTADHAETAYSGLASIVREHRRSAVTIEPHRDGATAVRWARSDHDADEIGVHTGNGSWWLPATVENAALVQEFLHAAATGTVTEDVIDIGDGEKRLDTCVTAVNGQKWVSGTLFEPVYAADGTMVVVGDLWERVQRGPHSYAPWAG